MDRGYFEIVRLLLESAPEILGGNSGLAVKGGTAINLFVLNMPRLSVDIDAVYTDHRASRDEALRRTAERFREAQARLSKLGIRSKIAATKQAEEAKLFIRRGRSQVKVEVNHVFRGTLFPAEERRLADEPRKMFTMDASL